MKFLTKNNELYAITARPQITQKQTLKWINEHFPNTFKGVYFTNLFLPEGAVKKNKSLVCLEVGAEMMIEDHLEFAIDCSSQGIKVFLLDYSWNQSENLPENVQRVKSWKEITNLID